MIVLLAAGGLVILAGLAAIGFGIPVKEFGFGNTLILTGAVGVCTGLIMVSIGLAVRELKKAMLLPLAAEPAAAAPRRELKLPPAVADEADDEDDAPEREAPLFSRDQPAPRLPAGPEPGVPPWQDEVLRDRERMAAAAAGNPPADEPKRRNLLFSSSRRERERNDAAPAPATDAAPEQPKPFPENMPERPRADAFRRAARAPSNFADQIPDTALIPERYVPPAPAEPARASDVTVLKSGIVDGMAYSLYSDGSIEAQMPEGRMHFGSIDELREHLDQRS